MRVAFDSDGVLDNFGEGVRETLIARGQGHLWKSGPTKGAFWNFFEDWKQHDGTPWDYPMFKELVDWGVDKGIVFSGHWRPNAIESVRRVKALGHEVIIITDRSFGSDPMNSQRNTIAAFERAGIDYDELHFSADKTCVPVDFMVEDKLENYDALVAAGVKAFLINRKWNEVEGGDARNRISDVSEFADAIEDSTAKGWADLAFA